MSNSIAVLIASTSAKTDWKVAKDAYFFKYTMPSIISLKSDDIPYKFFIGFDSDDDFFINNNDEIRDLMNKADLDFELISVDNPDHKPCPVWNTLFEIAYDQGFDYFLQTGDDIEYMDAFDEDFISYISSKDGVGVAGGTCDINTSLITQAFVPRSHMEIFGFLFPPELLDWASDNWLTHTYMAADRALKSDAYKIKNTKAVTNPRDVKSNRYVVSSNHVTMYHHCISKYTPKLNEATDGLL